MNKKYRMLPVMHEGETFDTYEEARQAAEKAAIVPNMNWHCFIVEDDKVLTEITENEVRAKAINLMNAIGLTREELGIDYNIYVYMFAKDMAHKEHLLYSAADIRYYIEMYTEPISKRAKVQYMDTLVSKGYVERITKIEKRYASKKEGTVDTEVVYYRIK